MKVKSKSILAALALAATTLVGQAAVSLVNTGSTQPANQGDGATTTWVNGFLGPDLVLLAKWSSNGWEAKALANPGDYIDVDPTIVNGGTTATIDWSMAGSGYGLYAIMGSQSSSLNLYEVTGGDFFTGSGIVDAPGNRNGWSHISFFGKPGTAGGNGTPVPDGGTTLLSFGVALLGLGTMRKLLAAKA